jgi:single-strand DNA-binding protein
MLNIAAVGNLGRDPELRDAGSSQVASFSLGVRTGQDETTWINCSVWGKRAETVMRFFKKGSQVTVAGQAKLRTYQKKDGTEGQSLELNVSDFSLPPREDGESKDGFPF